MKKKLLIQRALVAFGLLSLGVMNACNCGAPPLPPLPETRIDSGFTIEENAFPFANFGGTDSASRIDEESLIRLHGKEAICASDEADCRVRPLAKEYIRSVNKAMRGGRCEGFALLSGLLYAGDIDAADFGAATAAEMSLEDNDALGAEIAYWFATQYLQDVVMETTQALTAEEAVRFLSDEFSKEDHGMYRLGIARIDDSGKLTGGHAILPIAVGPAEAEGQFQIWVYDNNHPGEERVVTVDVNAGSWQYHAATNPDEPDATYSGDADNGNLLYLAALDPRLGRHTCSFCTGDGGEAAMQQVFGSAGVEVTSADSSGQETGEVDGRIVSNIPGSRAAPLLSDNFEDDTGVISFIPVSGSLSVRVRPSGTAEQDGEQEVVLFSDNTVAAITGIEVSTGDEATVDVDVAQNSVSYTPPANSDGGGQLTFGTTTEDGSETMVRVDLPPDGVESAEIVVDETTGNPTLSVQSEGDTTVNVTIEISTDTGDTTFTGEVPAPADGSATLLVDQFEEGGDLGAEVDDDGDGTSDTTVVVVDVGEEPVPPTAPTDLAAVLTGTEVALTWTDNAVNEGSYLVERDLGDGYVTIASLAADSTDYTDLTAPELSVVRYRVSARNVHGSTPSNEVRVTTGCPTGESRIGNLCGVGHTLGGSVSGLTGTLVLQNGSIEFLTVVADGPFTFTVPVAEAGSYDVSVRTQPDGQLCTVENGQGTMGTTDVNNVVVTCVATYLVGGTVNGLTGPLVLQNNGGDNLTLTADGDFSFATPLVDGGSYDVTILSLPVGQTCTIEGGSGGIQGADVTGVLVTCFAAFTVGGTASIPAGFTVTLQNGGDVVVLTDADVTFVFPTPVSDGAPYGVVILDNGGLSCELQNSEGTVTANVTNVTLTCFEVVSGVDASFASQDMSSSATDDENAFVVATLPDDSMLLGGTTGVGVGNDWVVVRVNVDGSQDLTYGTAGFATFGIGGTGIKDVRCILPQGDGSAVIVGTVPTGMGMARIDINGSIDLTFGSGAGVDVFSEQFSTNIEARACAQLSDGTFFIATDFITGGGDRALRHYHILADGTRDVAFPQGFPSNGQEVVNVGAPSEELAFAAVLTAGDVFTIFGRQNDAAFIYRVTLAGFDSAFGGGGFVTHDLSAGGGGTLSQFDDAVADGFGGFVAAGSFDNGAGRTPVVMRMDITGAGDPNFDGDGMVQIAPTAAEVAPFSVEMQLGGQIVFASYNGTNGLLRRFDGNGVVDATFGTAGVLTLDVAVQDLAIDGTGRILVGGKTFNSPGGDLAVVRVLP